MMNVVSIVRSNVFLNDEVFRLKFHAFHISAVDLNIPADSII